MNAPEVFRSASNVSLPFSMSAASTDIQDSPSVVMQKLEGVVFELIQKDAVPIPPYPAVAARLRTLLQTSSYAIDDLVQLVAGDQTIAAQILQLANSGAHGGKPPMHTLRGAIIRVGQREVERVAIAASIGAAARGAGALSDIRRGVWRRAVMSAQLAQRLAPLYGLPADTLFMTGLLHDFGCIIALAALETALAAVAPTFAIEESEWHALIDRYHVRFGMLVGRRWSLPDEICDVIAMHHDAEAFGVHAPSVRFIQRVDSLVGVVDSGVPLNEESFAHLKLADRFVSEAIKAMPDIVQQLAVFEPPPPDVGDRCAVLARAPQLGKPVRELDVGAHLVVTNVKVPLQITHAGPFGMLGKSGTRVSSTQLVRLSITISPQDRLEMWVVAQLASREGRFFVYELTPFASDNSVNLDYLKWLKT